MDTMDTMVTHIGELRFNAIARNAYENIRNMQILDACVYLFDQFDIDMAQDQMSEILMRMENDDSFELFKNYLNNYGIYDEYELETDIEDEDEDEDEDDFYSENETE